MQRVRNEGWDGIDVAGQQQLGEPVSPGVGVKIKSFLLSGTPRRDNLFLDGQVVGAEEVQEEIPNAFLIFAD